MLIKNIFSAGLSLIKTTYSKASNTFPKELITNNNPNPKRLSVLSTPKGRHILGEERPEMPTHDEYLAGHETRQQLWAGLAESPDSNEIKKLIEIIRDDFTLQQQAQLAEIIKIGKAGGAASQVPDARRMTRTLLQAGKDMRAVVINNDSHQLFTKHLIEVSQELHKIRGTLQKQIEVLREQKESQERNSSINKVSTSVKEISALIQEANLFTVLNSGIIYEEIKKYIDLNPNVSTEDLFFSATERLLTTSVGQGTGFLENVNITARDPNTNEFYTSVPYFTKAIGWSVRRELANNSRGIRLPVHINDALLKLKRIEEAYSKLDTKNRPTFEEYYAQKIAKQSINKAYSTLDIENRPTFENYYAQEISESIKKAKIKLSELRGVNNTVANPYSLDALRTLTYDDSRYDEANQVSVPLVNLTASNEELSALDYVEKGLLAKYLEETLATLIPQQRTVLELRYGLKQLTSNQDLIYGMDLTQSHRPNKDMEMSLTEIGTILDLSKERIRQIENKALAALRYLRRKEVLKPFSEKYSLPTSGEIQTKRETYLEDKKERINTDELKLLNNEVNINAAQKVIQNYQSLLEAKLQELQLFNSNQIDELLKCENQAEVQAYLKKKNILFKDREQYEEFTTLLNDYSSSKTKEGRNKILQSILNPNVREQSKLLLENTGLTKETGADFMAYLRSLTNHSVELQKNSEVASISLEEKRVNNMRMKSFGYLSNAVCSLFSRNEISHYASDEILRAADEIYQRTGSWSEIGIFSPEIIPLLAENNNSFAALFRKMGYSFYYEKTNYIRLNADLILEQIKNSFNINKGLTTTEKSTETMPKASDDPANVAPELTNTVKKVRPLIGRKADYSNVRASYYRIENLEIWGEAIHDRETLANQLMFKALDRLIKQNNDSLDGLVHFLDTKGSAAFDQFLEKNPDITFSEIYEKIGNDWNLSYLDPSIGKLFRLNGAINLPSRKILAEAQSMILGKTLPEVRAMLRKRESKVATPISNTKPAETIPKAFDQLTNVASEPTDTVKKARPLIGRKADYKNINEIMHQIKYSQVSGRYIQINELSLAKLMFEALDRLIEKNNGSLDGIVHLKDGNSGSAFEEFLQANPNITFSEIYEVLENNTWSLSNLDSSLNPKLKLNGAIHLHENKILAEINNMVLEKRSKPTETNRKPSSLIGKQSPDITLTNLSDPLSLQAIREMGGFDY